MNYIISLLVVSVILLFLYSRHLYDENNILIENEKVIISGYETSIKNIEDKAKFDLGIEKSKTPTIKASEKVKVEEKKRGKINESNTNSDFVIVSF